MCTRYANPNGRNFLNQLSKLELECDGRRNSQHSETGVPRKCPSSSAGTIKYLGLVAPIRDEHPHRTEMLANLLSTAHEGLLVKSEFYISHLFFAITFYGS